MEAPDDDTFKISKYFSKCFDIIAAAKVNHQTTVLKPMGGRCTERRAACRSAMWRWTECICGNCIGIYDRKCLPTEEKVRLQMYFQLSRHWCCVSSAGLRSRMLFSTWLQKRVTFSPTMGMLRCRTAPLLLADSLCEQLHAPTDFA